MNSRTQSFLIPKQGLAQAENEDSLSIARSKGAFCVCDGASDSFDARSWSRLLVAAWRLKPEFDPGRLREGIMALGSRWRKKWDRELPWYAEEKARQGAFAAFVGVVIDGDAWKAIAVGDCCLFYWNDAASPPTSFPIGNPFDFGTNPHLIGSTNLLSFEEHIATTQGLIVPGSRMLLMSDAISAWYMKGLADYPERVQEFETLLATQERGALTAICEQERAAGRLRNDDIAAIRVSFEP